MVLPVCPFPPEPWGLQMKQQVIAFQRNKVLHFPVKHRVNLRNSFLQNAASARSLKKTNSWIYGGKIEWVKLKLKVLAPAQDRFRHGSEQAVRHFGEGSLFLHYFLALQLAATRNMGWSAVVWPLPFSGPVMELVPSLWNQNNAAVPALHTCCFAHLPILTITYNQMFTLIHEF